MSSVNLGVSEVSGEIAHFKVLSESESMACRVHLGRSCDSTSWSWNSNPHAFVRSSAANQFGVDPTQYRLAFQDDGGHFNVVSSDSDAETAWLESKPKNLENPTISFMKKIADPEEEIRTRRKHEALTMREAGLGTKAAPLSADAESASAALAKREQPEELRVRENQLSAMQRELEESMTRREEAFEAGMREREENLKERRECLMERLEAVRERVEAVREREERVREREERMKEREEPTRGLSVATQNFQLSDQLFRVAVERGDEGTEGRELQEQFVYSSSSEEVWEKEEDEVQEDSSSSEEDEEKEKEDDEDEDEDEDGEVEEGRERGELEGGERDDERVAEGTGPGQWHDCVFEPGGNLTSLLEVVCETLDLEPADVRASLNACNPNQGQGYLARHGVLQALLAVIDALHASKVTRSDSDSPTEVNATKSEGNDSEVVAVQASNASYLSGGSGAESADIASSESSGVERELTCEWLATASRVQQTQTLACLSINTVQRFVAI